MISYDREFTLLSQLSSEGSPLGNPFPFPLDGSLANIPVDPLISAYQYFAQIVVETSVVSPSHLP
jgi:hypothetical protein